MEEQAKQEIARLQAEEMGLPYEPPPQMRLQPQRNVEVVRRTQAQQPQQPAFGRSQISDSDDEMDNIIGDLDSKLKQKEDHFRSIENPQTRLETPPDFERANPNQGRFMASSEDFGQPPQLAVPSMGPGASRRTPGTADNRPFGGLSSIPEMGSRT